MTASPIASLLDGGIPLLGGLLATLYGHRLIGGRRGDPPWDEWHRRYGGLLKICGPLLILFGLGVMAAPFVPSTRTDVPVGSSPLLPTKVGSTWVYTAGAGDLTFRISVHEAANGVLCARREVVVNGKTVMTEHLRPELGAVFKQASNGLPYSPAFPLVKDLTVPATWDYRSTEGAMSLHCEQKEGGPLKTPMKSFEESVLVTMRGKDQSGEVLTQQWYVRGIGLVREYSMLKGKEFVMELRSFSPGP